jgi:hypothetical protein
MRIFFIDSSSFKDVKKIFLAFLNIGNYFKWIKNNQKRENSQKILNGIIKNIKNHFQKLELKREIMQLVPYFLDLKWKSNKFLK